MPSPCGDPPQDGSDSGAFELGCALQALKARDIARYVELVTPLVGDAERAARLWHLLASNHGSEFDLLELLLMWPQADAATWLLAPAVAHLGALTFEEAMALLVFSGRVDQSYHRSIVEALQPHVAHDPALGERLGEALKTGSFSSKQLLVWAGSFCGGAGVTAVTYAISLPEGDEGADRLLAAVLCCLPMQEPGVQQFVREHEAMLVERVAGSVFSTGREAWFALGVLTQTSAKAVELLAEAATSGNADAMDAISVTLHSGDTECIGASGVKVGEIVDRLLHAALGNLGLRQKVSRLLAALVYRGNLRSFVVGRLEALGQVTQVDAGELFAEAFDALAQYRDAFASVLTSWLIWDHVSLGALRSLLSRCSSSPELVALESTSYAAAPVERRAAAGLRLLALCYHGPVLCRFIGLLAETPTLQPEGLQQAAALLNEAFLEYPTATVDFLKSRTRVAMRREPYAAVYRGVLTNALRWQRLLAKLPKVAELRPSAAEFQALSAMRWRQNKEILRMARERSVLASLAKQVHVAQGKRVASHVSHGLPRVSTMVERSYTMELPSSEVADPVGGALRRIQRLSRAK